MAAIVDEVVAVPPGAARAHLREPGPEGVPIALHRDGVRERRNRLLNEMIARKDAVPLETGRADRVEHAQHVGRGRPDRKTDGQLGVPRLLESGELVGRDRPAAVVLPPEAPDRSHHPLDAGLLGERHPPRPLRGDRRERHLGPHRRGRLSAQPSGNPDRELAQHEERVHDRVAEVRLPDGAERLIGRGVNRCLANLCHVEGREIPVDQYGVPRVECVLESTEAGLNAIERRDEVRLRVEMKESLHVLHSCPTLNLRNSTKRLTGGES